MGDASGKDAEVARLCAVLEDKETTLRCRAERAFLRTIGGGCSLPIATTSTLASGELLLEGLVASLDGQRRCLVSISGPCTTVPEAEALGSRLCEKLRQEGGEAILAELREQVQEPAAQAQ